MHSAYSYPSHKRPRPTDSPRDPNFPIPYDSSSSSSFQHSQHQALSPTLSHSSSNFSAASTTTNTTSAPTSTPKSSGGGGGGGGGHSGSSSSFRNVSACNRCRLRKNRCDQNLPACASCTKARVKCVGYDPITKREIPRAYVYYLESRVGYLEGLLKVHGIGFKGPEEFDVGTEENQLDDGGGGGGGGGGVAGGGEGMDGKGEAEKEKKEAISKSRIARRKEEAEKLEKLVSGVGMVSVQGASDPRFLGSTNGITFARVVFAAVRSSISGSSSQRGTGPGGIYRAASTAAAAVNGTTFRDSFFGLQSKTAYKEAPFPDREIGTKLVNLYFEHANPQIPTLHRGEFMALFERAYSVDSGKRSPRELYMLNIVFAMGAGIILKDPKSAAQEAGIPEEDTKNEGTGGTGNSPRGKRLKLMTGQCQPEEYHASAMVHLEYFLGSSPAADRPEGFGGSLEELQAVLLLAGFALLRPVAPGLWYIVGVAVRLAVDLGLHYEDGAGVDDSMGGAANEGAGVRSSSVSTKEKGRREWVRDLRRRLWWCVYSFDRLVSTCVGRPFGITDQVITTEFPSVLDDHYITTSGFTAPESAYHEPSYKRVAHHYFRLRLLQSEILQVLQYRQAQEARAKGRNRQNEFMHTKLQSPFLTPFDGFYSWRRDIDRRLWEWKESAPHVEDTTVSFDIQFLELNYWQAIIMLYRQSLSVPPELGDEHSPAEEIASPMHDHVDEEDDEEVFHKVAVAGQRVLKLYRQLHRVHLVNYTFLSTHHLFMAGIAFLYAIWHSEKVRSRLTLDDVDFTILAATTVLTDLIDKCPPAEACRDAFDRMAKATVHMCLASTGFGTRAPTLAPPKARHGRPVHSRSSSNTSQPQSSGNTTQFQFVQAQNEQGFFRPQRQRPQFDMNLHDLFPEETVEKRKFRNSIWQTSAPQLQHQEMLPPQMPTPQYQMAPSQYDPSLRGSASPTASYAQSYDSPQMSQAAFPYDPALQMMQTDAPYESYNFSSDINSLLAEPEGSYNGTHGLSLGFDSEHDWNDGTGVDLFDGFFFGGYVNGAGQNNTPGMGVSPLGGHADMNNEG